MNGMAILRHTFSTKTDAPLFTLDSWQAGQLPAQECTPAHVPTAMDTAKHMDSCLLPAAAPLPVGLSTLEMHYWGLNGRPVCCTLPAIGVASIDVQRSD